MLNPEHLLRQARDNIRKNWKQETIVQVDPTTHLAPDGPPAEAATEPVGSGQPHDSDAFASNIPRCVVCGGVARPAVKMFQDSDTWVDADDSGRFNEFLGATNAFFARLYGKKRSFYQDRLGTNIGKVEQRERERGAFFAGTPRW
jgi:hypothetical protein